jgi:hypothetical protein
MALRVLLFAAALCATISRGRAEEPQRSSPDAGIEQQRPPLSAEDAQLVQQLALLEDVELLRNLDLFDTRPADAAQAPDGGAVAPPREPNR